MERCDIGGCTRPVVQLLACTKTTADGKRCTFRITRCAEHGGRSGGGQMAGHIRGHASKGSTTPAKVRTLPNSSITLGSFERAVSTLRESVEREVARRLEPAVNAEVSRRIDEIRESMRAQMQRETHAEKWSERKARERRRG